MISLYVYLVYIINCVQPTCFFFFFFNDTATTEIYTLSLHDALPIYPAGRGNHFLSRGRSRRPARDRAGVQSRPYISLPRRKSPPRVRRRRGAGRRMALRQKRVLRIQRYLARAIATKFVCSSSGRLASASESLSRGLGSRWFTEGFHRNALVTDFQHGQVFCAARRFENYAVARRRFHQRAPQR